MSKYNSLRKDFHAIAQAAYAHDLLNPLMKHEELAAPLSEVWNAILDLQICAIHKVLDNNPDIASTLEYVLSQYKTLP